LVYPNVPIAGSGNLFCLELSNSSFNWLANNDDRNGFGNSPCLDNLHLKNLHTGKVISFPLFLRRKRVKSQNPHIALKKEVEKMARKKTIEVKFDSKPDCDWKVYNKALKKAAKYWRNILKLQNWEIKIDVVPPFALPGDSIAEISTDYTYLQAKIWISSEARIEWFDSIISHEMLHIKIGAIRAVLDYLEDRITEQEVSLILRTEESVVESLSRILCQILGVDSYHSGDLNDQEEIQIFACK
jgi:hypothetical protein